MEEQAECGFSSVGCGAASISHGLIGQPCRPGRSLRHRNAWNHRVVRVDIPFHSVPISTTIKLTTNRDEDVKEIKRCKLRRKHCLRGRSS